MKAKDDTLAELYRGKFESHVSVLTRLREQLEDPAAAKNKQTLDDASAKVTVLKTDLCAWKKLSDVYSPATASEGSVATPGRSKKAGGKAAPLSEASSASKAPRGAKRNP